MAWKIFFPFVFVLLFHCPPSSWGKPGSNDYLNVDSLGRPALIGELYNAATRKFLGISIFRMELPKFITTNTSTEEIFLVKTTDINYSEVNKGVVPSIREKMSLLYVDPEDAVDIKAGIVRVKGQGSAAYLNDEKKNRRHVEGFLQAKERTVREQLIIFHEDLRPFLNIPVIQNQKIQATHVVIAVEYGGDLLVKFLDTNEDNREVNLVADDLRVELKLKAPKPRVNETRIGLKQLDFGENSNSTDTSTIPEISIEEHHEVNPSANLTLENGSDNSNNNSSSNLNMISNKRSNVTTSYNVRVFSDFSLDANALPRNFEEALELASKLPQLIGKTNGGKGKPMKYVLMPLEMIKDFYVPEQQSGIGIGSSRESSSIVVNELDEALMTNVLTSFSDNVEAQAILNDVQEKLERHQREKCVNETHLESIVDLQNHFQKMALNFKVKVRKSMEAIRNGKKSEVDLEVINNGQHQHQYASSYLSHYLKEFAEAEALIDVGKCDADVVVTQTVSTQTPTSEGSSSTNNDNVTETGDEESIINV